MRFGKLKLLKSKRKTVTLTVNGIENEHVAMILGDAGEAFFVRQQIDLPVKPNTAKKGQTQAQEPS